MNPKIIEISAGNPDQIEKDLVTQMGLSQLAKNSYEIPQRLGNGFMQKIALNQDVLVSLMEYELKEALIVKRISNPLSRFYPILLQFR
ncbi:MAG: hypothetical protein DHS20C17_05600 [Cyclobacteriaceae bacterium]|nr:MAG: hypothetical protein DHS20C17_05600 [Cyclobacteriaceae bacterium]